MSDEIETFEGYLEGDGFVNEQAKVEDAANLRRLKRKRRLEAMKKSQESEVTVSVWKQTGQVGAEIPKKASGRNKIDADSSFISGPTQVGSDTSAGNRNDEGDERDVDADEFDMFSSSDSPPSRIFNVSRNRDNGTLSGMVDKQQDWDDAEGYYKATIGQ